MRKLLFFLFTVGLTSVANAAKPNIVFILADDLGIGDLSCYNPDSKIQTPHMDALAKAGIRFTDAHSNSSVCTPTRYGILTGRYCWRSKLGTGVTWGASPSIIPESRATVASFLKSHGYNTGCVGKWHLGLGWVKENNKIQYDQPITLGPNQLGFDYFFGIPASLDMQDYVYIENDKVLDLPTEKFEGKRGQGMIRRGMAFPGFDETNVLPDFTTKAVAFLERQSTDTPFFLYFPLASPHTPVVPTAAFKGKSEAGIYGDFVMATDWAMGQVVATLKKKNLLDNTLIIVTSDNGSSPHGYPLAAEKEHQHNTSYIYKGRKSHTYEGGHRVPFIAHWPKTIKKASVSDAIVCTTDLFKTAAAILGQALPDTAAEDSVSFLSVLRDKPEGLRESVVHHSLNGTFCLRDGKWKAIFGPGQGGFRDIKEPISKNPIQLYDLEADIGETTDLANDHPETIQRMKKQLLQLVADGRSTPGNNQPNDRIINIKK